MWQTGYLTISESFELFDEIRYRLSIPNQEVKISLMSSISEYITKCNIVESKDKIKHILYKQELDKLETSLKSLYASIPYNNFTNNKMYKYEGYYVSLFYVYMKALGFDMVGEDVTNRGRIDLTIKLDNSIYIIEFKTDGSSALSQIKERNYHQKYLSDNLPIYLVGIEFDTKKRNISKIEYERV
jgi:ATP-dependent exoDNAse (exonuclease V) beta subunit